MEPEQIITLFDLIWFENKILQKHPKDPIFKTTQKPDSKTDFSNLPTIHVRSKSDEMSSIKTFQDSFSPNSVLISPKLQTIISGKEEKLETESPKQRRRRRKTNKGWTKSLTDLEFEELKGFMDLGFVFSEEDVKSNLVEIIPGLQRLGKKEIDIDIYTERESESESKVQRPYLSEAWMFLEKKEKINPLDNWKIKDLGSEIDVKQSLKWWAQSVASTVR